MRTRFIVRVSALYFDLPGRLPGFSLSVPVLVFSNSGLTSGAAAAASLAGEVRLQIGKANVTAIGLGINDNGVGAPVVAAKDQQPARAVVGSHFPESDFLLPILLNDEPFLTGTRLTLDGDAGRDLEFWASSRVRDQRPQSRVTDGLNVGGRARERLDLSIKLKIAKGMLAGALKMIEHCECKGQYRG